MNRKPVKLKMARVLIIEDNDNFRKALKSLISSRYPSMVFEKAVNEQEAFEKINQSIPDLIFSDVSLPGENGFELIGKIRDACPSTLIVSMSYENSSEYYKAAMKIGADYHVSKGSMTLEVIDELVKPLMPETVHHNGINRRKDLRLREKDLLFVSLKSESKEQWGKL
jgi:two-component system, response regulator YesN